MKINIEQMTLSQGLDCIQRLQSWLDECLQDRVEFMQEWANSGQDDRGYGILMAHVWREEAMKHLLQSLRDEVCDKYEPTGEQDDAKGEE